MSSVQLRRLSRELVRLRKACDLTVEEVTVAMEWSRGRLTYYELAKWQRADVGNVGRLLDLYGVTGEVREALLGLARQSKIKGWWAAYRDIFPMSLPSFEDAATVIRTVEPSLVPGLLQTPEYTTGLLLGGEISVDASVVERKAKARQARQQILGRDNAPEFWAVIDEAALVRLVGGAKVMHAQVQHLIEMADRPQITIQVLPLRAGAHAGLAGGFVILDFASAEDAPLAYLEGAVSSVFMENPEDVQRYTLIFNRVITSALTPEESVSHMMSLLEQLN